ncbi:MAG: MGMT family protein [Kiritimatiellae bacterium]|nr:MGMT family protein [Kiritimatiellia bacterium]
METIYEEMRDHPQITPFRLRVFEALLEVPGGYVTTYGALAERVGCDCARAIGGALRNNPLAPAVPCHRVVASDLTIGGFSGQRSGAMIEKKLALLQAEGVHFDANGRVEGRSLWQW